MLHLATHGFFLGDECDGVLPQNTRAVGGLTGGAPATSPVPTARPQMQRRSTTPENPLLLSGLALAGANRRATAGADEDDGILTAEEVAGLDLTGLDWAVSVRTEDGLVEPTGGLEGQAPEKLYLTFDRLLARTRFANLMRERLRRLEDAFGTPINVEFAQVEDRFYLLQCRPLVQAEAAEAGKLPRGVKHDDIVFYTRGLIRSIPRIDRAAVAKSRLETIGGVVPSLLRPPPGCRFAARCPHAMAKCREMSPPLLEVRRGHKVACVLEQPEAGQ